MGTRLAKLSANVVPLQSSSVTVQPTSPRCSPKGPLCDSELVSVTADLRLFRLFRLVRSRRGPVSSTCSDVCQVSPRILGFRACLLHEQLHSLFCLGRSGEPRRVACRRRYDPAVCDRLLEASSHFALEAGCERGLDWDHGEGPDAPDSSSDHDCERRGSLNPFSCPEPLCFWHLPLCQQPSLDHPDLRVAPQWHVALARQLSPPRVSHSWAYLKIRTPLLPLVSCDECPLRRGGAPHGGHEPRNT
mmetsp:Transcript_8035/g.22192  ORF Transcript_8035/g.22192 Transcript_8035/m.22192 type:complete len:246 (-) Transcript_8035:948-1685(-)